VPSQGLVRATAVLTAGYGALLVIRPETLARPAGLVGDGDVPPHVAALTRSIGMRDLALSLLAVAAPSGRPLAAVTTARVLVDVTDALWFARMAQPPAVRAKVSSAAAGWAALQAAASVYAWRRQMRR
jgi:hypothetical protein